MFDFRTPENYAEDLNLAAQVLFAPKHVDGDISELLSVLGCREITRDYGYPRDTHWFLSSPPQPPQSHEPIVLECLLQALRWYGAQSIRIDTHGFALLDGFLKNDRWRSAVGTVEDAYVLADILETLSRKSNKGNVHMDFQDVLARETIPCAMALLNAWTTPETPLSAPLRIDTVQRALFGDAWWALNELNPDDVASAFTNCRVPRGQFLPGLVTTQGEFAAVALPDMDAL
jgi:hypothetical protein